MVSAVSLCRQLRPRSLRMTALLRMGKSFRRRTKKPLLLYSPLGHSPMGIYVSLQTPLRGISICSFTLFYYYGAQNEQAAQYERIAYWDLFPCGDFVPKTYSFDRYTLKKSRDPFIDWGQIAAHPRGGPLRGCLLGNQTRDSVAFFSLAPLAQASLARLPLKKPRPWGLGLVS